MQRALYEDKTLIRLLGMRRTVFVTTLDIAPVIQAACSRAVAANSGASCWAIWPTPAWATT